MECTPSWPCQDYYTAYWTANNYWNNTEHNYWNNTELDDTELFDETETEIFDDLEQLERERDIIEVMSRRKRSTKSSYSAGSSFFKCLKDEQCSEAVSKSFNIFNMKKNHKIENLSS